MKEINKETKIKGIKLIPFFDRIKLLFCKRHQYVEYNDNTMVEMYYKKLNGKNYIVKEIKTDVRW